MYLIGFTLFTLAADRVRRRRRNYIGAPGAATRPRPQCRGLNAKSLLQPSLEERFLAGIGKLRDV
jgi:hypothetical protein